MTVTIGARVRLFAALVAALCRCPAWAAGVVGNGDAATCTEAALDAALENGGSVTFACGSAPFTIPVTTTKRIDVDTSIDGGGLLTLDGGGSVRILQVGSYTLELSNATLRRGFSATYGGAIAASYGDLNATNCVFADNTAPDGAAIRTFGTTQVTNCTFSGNHGGAIASHDGELVVTNSTFTANTAVSGAAIYAGGSQSVTVDASSFTDNVSAGPDSQGGAIFAFADSFAVSNSRFMNNRGRCGAAVFLLGTHSGRIATSLFAHNRVEPQERSGVTFECGGGAVVAGDLIGELSIESSTFSDNTAGCLRSNPDSIPPAFCGGGAVMAWTGGRGTLAIADSTFADNAVGLDRGNGGALSIVDVRTSVTNSTFYANSISGPGNGGAIAAYLYNYYAPDTFLLTVTDTTIAHNTVGSSGSGSALALDAADEPFPEPATAFLQNTIVASSTPSANCAGGGFVDGGHSIDDGASCGLSRATGSLPNTDPRLDPAGLTDNGGPTHTVALQPDSPAINAGDDTICAAEPVGGVDQRGQARPGTATHCSIGAYEYAGAWTPPTVTPTATPSPALTETPTTTPTPNPTPLFSCTGDCDGNGGVTVNELIIMVNLALGGAAGAACPGVDQWCGAAGVAVDCIIAAVNRALDGCG